jgi:hypothetical protein
VKTLGIGDILQKYDEETLVTKDDWAPIGEFCWSKLITESDLRFLKFRRPSNSICKLTGARIRLLGVQISEDQYHSLLKLDQRIHDSSFHIRSTDLYKIFSPVDAKKLHDYCKTHDLYVKDTTTCMAEQKAAELKAKVAQAAPAEYDYPTVCTLQNGDEVQCMTDTWSPVPEKYWGTRCEAAIQCKIRRPKAGGLHSILQKDEKVTLQLTPSGRSLQVTVENVSNSKWHISHIPVGTSVIQAIKELLTQIRE